MAGRLRSTESPMDFEFTSRPSSNAKPVWAERNGEPSTPRKRGADALHPPTSPFPGPHTPTFGRLQDVPFIFNTPPPQEPREYPWQPPAGFSPTKAFPQTELRDVDMPDASPPRPPSPEKEGEEDGHSDRAIALGGLRRVFKSRQKARSKSKLAIITTRKGEDRNDDSDESDEEGERGVTPITQNTSNHYTLNLPGPAPVQSDMPYVLLGYLQFFFNLSLILLFLYLLVLFILTVQRDVEHRISEYSMDIVQEIAQCAMQYKTNQCATNPMPALLHQCGLWETCMNRDPTKVGRAKVGAELIAEVVNGFVEPISWKTLIFTVLSLSSLTFFINALLSLYRSKLNPSAQPHYPSGMGPYSAQPGVAFPPILNTAPHWGKSWAGPPEVEGMPSRRRKLEGGAVKEIK
ncbi:hypothetical protein QCA50_008517 [Cerrena zonata]|uniref:Brl1/Brr6 domain-containing protein n=1 Tax=Cerrena zonata TaxID=2478898 RepID=A0AAW0G6W5_9APHY